MPEDEGRKLSELQLATGQVPERIYGVSSGLSLAFTPKQVVDTGRPFATDAQARAGIRTDMGMSPSLVLAAMEQYAADVTNPSLTGLQAAINTVQGNLNTTNGVVSGHTTRIAALETTVNAMPGDYISRITIASFNSVTSLEGSSVPTPIISVVINGDIYKRTPGGGPVPAGVIVAADGSRWTKQGQTDRPKEFILAYSQSNFAGRNTENNWIVPPPSNLFVWNGGNWSGDQVPPVGDAFVAASTRAPQVPIAYAAELARDDPGTDYYLVIVARGGTGVRALAGVRYAFNTATTGAPASGRLRFNAGNTQIAFHETDLQGYSRFVGGTDWGTSTYYPARIQTTTDGGNSWIEFTPAAMTDQGDYRTQNVTVTGSANWPPADGTDITVFPAEPRMRTLMNAVVPAAMNAIGLTGSQRVVSRLLIWPTEADINYPEAYKNVDFNYILAFLSSYLTENTMILMTLPWPYGAGIEPTRSFFWTAIRDIVAVNPDMRTLVDLSKSGVRNWGDDNNIHAVNREAVGVYMRRSEETGGTDLIQGSGVYTPALSDGVNVTSSTALECMWTRIGDIVTVSGAVLVNPTNTATLTSIQFTLPVASDLPAPHWLAGVAASVTFSDHSGHIAGNATTDRAVLTFTSRAGGGAGSSWSFQYSYRVRRTS